MSPFTQDGRKYLTAEELVERWRGLVSAGTLANWRSSGRGPIWTQLGRAISYAVVDVETWEAANRRGTTRAKET